MKHYFVAIFLVLLFTGCTNSGKKTNNTKEKNEYRNYDFKIVINTEHSGNDFDYIINRKYYSFEGKNDFVCHDDKLLEEVFYEYKTKKNSNEVEKTPVKAINYQLNNQQLDTLYLLTSKLFKVDSLNLVNDTVEKDCNYDGPYHEITFSSRKAIYKITFTNLSDKDIVEKYRKLLAYIESIKKKKDKR